MVNRRALITFLSTAAASTRRNNSAFAFAPSRHYTANHCPLRTTSFSTNAITAAATNDDDVGLTHRASTFHAEITNDIAEDTLPLTVAVAVEELATPKKKKGLHDTFQPNNRKGWDNMALYWAIGHFIGMREGYLTKMLQLPSLSKPIAIIIALVGTLLCQQELNTRYTKFERKTDYPATTVFAIANGIWESFLFLFTYDLGRKYLAQAFSFSKRAAISAGFTSYIIYASVIHVGFWLPSGFPKHVKDGAPPFQKHGLPLLFVISGIWFYIYEKFNDVALFCILHTIVDAWVALNIGLQSPWNFKRPSWFEQKKENIDNTIYEATA